MRDGNIPIYQPQPRWQPVEVELSNGQKHAVAYVANPAWQIKTNNHKRKPAKLLPAGGYNCPCVLERRK